MKIRSWSYFGAVLFTGNIGICLGSALSSLIATFLNSSCLNIEYRTILMSDQSNNLVFDQSVSSTRPDIGMTAYLRLQRFTLKTETTQCGLVWNGGDRINYLFKKAWVGVKWFWLMSRFINPEGSE